MICYDEHGIGFAKEEWGVTRRELTKFAVPEVRTQYMDKYGDPLEDVSPQDLMDLMENLWTSSRGTYAVLREKLRREGQDPWTVRLALVESYFKTLFMRTAEFTESDEPVKYLDVTYFIQYRIEELIKSHQEQEAEESRYSRDKFGIRAPRV
jgi:hypothetical protein